MDEALKVLAKLQREGVEFRSQPDGTVKVKMEGGLSPQQTQLLIKHREEIERLCVYDHETAYELISEALRYMSQNANQGEFLRAHLDYKEGIELACAGEDMPLLRQMVRNMVRQCVKGKREAKSR